MSMVRVTHHLYPGDPVRFWIGGCVEGEVDLGTVVDMDPRGDCIVTIDSATGRGRHFVVRDEVSLQEAPSLADRHSVFLRQTFGVPRLGQWGA